MLLSEFPKPWGVCAKITLKFPGGGEKMNTRSPGSWAPPVWWLLEGPVLGQTQDSQAGGVGGWSQTLH